MNWLVGCWQMRAGNRVTIEEWERVGAALVGNSHSTVDGAVRESEQLRLTAIGDTLNYHARPSGQAESDFRTAGRPASFDSVVFANPAHDFPKRIIYRRIG